MPEMPSIAEVAEQLRRAQETHEPCKPVRDILPPDDVAAAYAVQETNTEYRLRPPPTSCGRQHTLLSERTEPESNLDADCQTESGATRTPRPDRLCAAANVGLPHR